MRVATFNLESLDLPPDSPVPLEARADILRPQLDRLEADILCLQEVNGQKEPGTKGRTLRALEQLLQGTRYASYARVSTSGPLGKGVADIHNLVVLSRFEITSHREVRHDLVQPVTYKPSTAVPHANRDLLIEWDRPILSVEIELPGNRHMTILNAHLRAPLAVPVTGQKKAPFVWKSVGGWAEGYFMAGMKRLGQALELRLILEQLLDADPHCLIAVCGDFNAEDHEATLRIVVGAEEDTGNGSLAARAVIPLERSLPHDRRFSALHHGRAQLPDHILASRQLMAHFRKLEIHNETLEDELIAYAKVERPPDSYHAPVLAEFDFG